MMLSRLLAATAFYQGIRTRLKTPKRKVSKQIKALVSIGRYEQMESEEETIFSSDSGSCYDLVDTRSRREFNEEVATATTNSRMLGTRV